MAASMKKTAAAEDGSRRGYAQRAATATPISSGSATRAKALCASPLETVALATTTAAAAAPPIAAA
jgi:hypothetical protein